MKLIKPIALFLILFCLTNNAFAEKGHLTFRPYIELSNYAYQEPSVMEKTSDKPFLGLGLTVEAPILNDLVTLDVAYKTGTTNYSSVRTGKTSADPTNISRIEVKYVTKFDQLEVYSGIGYRSLFDSWGNKVTSTNHDTYDRRSQYVYVPLGMKFNNGFLSNTMVQFNFLLRGLQTSYFGTISGYQDTSKLQKSGWGVRSEKKISDNLQLFISYWDIKESEFNRGFYEPQNTTFETGVKLYFTKY